MPEARRGEEADACAPERAVAADMVRRSAVFAVPLTAAGLLGWGWSGAASAALALALVLVNFMLGAAAIGWGARLGGAAMMGAVLGGYLVRLGIVVAVVLPLRHSGWFEIAPFAVSLITTHLGLLVWETRHVSMSPAFPGLKPGHEFRLPLAASSPQRRP